MKEPEETGIFGSDMDCKYFLNVIPFALARIELAAKDIVRGEQPKTFTSAVASSRSRKILVQSAMYGKLE